MPPTYCPCNRPILKHTPSHTQHHHSHSPTNTNANANDLLHIDPSVLGQPTVRFPPRATLVTRTFLAHPSEDYDRSPIVVVPNACRLPERGCPGRTYSPTHTRTSLQRRQRSPMSSRKPHSSGGGSGGGGVTTPLPPLVADLTSSSEDDESDSSLAVLPPLGESPSPCLEYLFFLFLFFVWWFSSMPCIDLLASSQPPHMYTPFPVPALALASLPFYLSSSYHLLPRTHSAIGYPNSDFFFFSFTF
ncbi:hypothetical protein BC835DRAFT_136124 [Cytidiella melzeri]|nr:hypothetical protein BC835DRAFT_136124 [Cytidiella melzeri]